MAKASYKWALGLVVIVVVISTWMYMTEGQSGLHASIPIAERIGVSDRGSALVNIDLNGLADRGLASEAHVTSVLLVTYMRSGSSLTGDLLQQAPDAFYIYEPLHALFFWFRDHPDASLKYVNGTIKSPPLSLTEEAVQVLYNWFTCKLTHLPTLVMRDEFLNRGLKSKTYQSCRQSEKLTASNSPDDVTLKCTLDLQSICKSSPLRILKTIRVEIRQISHFLKLLPGFKIIHLVRDPRATMQSQRMVGMCRGNEEKACASRYCVRRENDLIEMDKLMMSYPGRVYTVNYEDIAKNPLAMAEKLHEMIGTQYTQKAREYTFNITMTGLENTCAICTTRSNSSEHVDAWKSRISKSLLDTIQERCNYILKRYDYGLIIN